MKKIIILVLVVALCLTAFAACGNKTDDKSTKVYSTDPFTSVSKPQAKYDLGVTPDELFKSGYNFSGTSLFVTTNPDATPNVGYVIFSVVKAGEKYYITQDALRHQSGVNLLREKGGLAIWAANYDSKGSIMDEKDPTNTKTKKFSTRGIKMTLKLNEDKAVMEELKLKEGTYAYEIVSFLPLG